jgi:hypothetical protein
MHIELTEQQRQLVQEQAGRPVEVIDPGTERAYVLLTREQYERVRALVEQPPPSPDKPEGQALPPVPYLLADLPTPPEVAEEARRCYARRGGFWGGKALAAIEQELKLQYYYGGRCVSWLRTRRGPLIMAAGRVASDNYGQQLEAIPAEQRYQLIHDLPSVWKDEVAQILTPYEDESWDHRGRS